MSFRYNLSALSGDRNFSVYDLEKKHILAGSTCDSIYHNRPIQTGTLLRLLDYADCSLDDFLVCSPAPAEKAPRKIDLNDMVRRCVISRTAKRHFHAGLPMSLSTLDAMADDQQVSLKDLFRVQVSLIPDDSGILKKKRNVLYLTEW